MVSKDDVKTVEQAGNCAADQMPAERDDVHQGRRFRVSNHRGKAAGKVRYIEGSAPPKSCRFL